MTDGFCKKHQVFLYDRGATRRIGMIDGVVSVKWERLRDDISVADVHIEGMSDECRKILDGARALRHELVIYRGNDRVWEGPITLIGRVGSSFDIQAKDVMFYAYRTVSRAGRKSRPVETVLARANALLTTELARKEALVPPINVVPHIRLMTTSDDARTAKVTQPYETTVFEDIDTMAIRSGLDYTVVGRSIILADTHTVFARTPMVGESDFIGDVIVTQYGMNGATHAFVTSAEGLVGVADDNANDPYFGEWEILDTAYDEDGTDAPTQSALDSQADRNLSGKMPPPIIVRVPQNATLNPDGALKITDLVPGTRIPLTATLSGTVITQMQKLNSVIVTETAEGETIRVSLGPATTNDADLEEEA